MPAYPEDLPAFTVKGSAFKAFFSPADGGILAGIYYATPALGIGAGPRIGDPNYVEVEHVFPDIAGIGITRMSTFGPRLISCDLAFVQPTVRQAEASYISHVDDWKQLARYSISARDTAFPNCRLESASFVGQTSLGGMSILVYSFTWKQYSPG